MPGKKHLFGVGPREQRAYEDIKESPGHSGAKAKEMVARTVMKQRKQKGHSAGR